MPAETKTPQRVKRPSNAQLRALRHLIRDGGWILEESRALRFTTATVRISVPTFCTLRDRGWIEEEELRIGRGLWRVSDAGREVAE